MMESQRQAREAVVAMMQEAGIEVVTDADAVRNEYEKSSQQIWQYLNTPSKNEVLALSIESKNVTEESAGLNHSAKGVASSSAIADAKGQTRTARL